MKQKRNVIRKSLFFTKLVLTVALLAGGGMTAWADDYVETLTFNNSIPSGWINGGKYGSITYSTFTINSDNIETANNFGTFSLTSESSELTINPGQKITITVKVKSNYSGSYQKVKINYTVDNSSYSTIKEFGSSDFNSQTDYVDLEYTVNTSNMASGCRLQFLAQAAVIKKIVISPTLPILTVIDEEVAPVEFKSGTTPQLKVKYTAVTGWNTICMPIVLKSYSVIDRMDALFGPDWKGYALSSYDNGVLTFTPIANSGYKNTPLLVYAPNATGSQTELNLTNEDVTYSASPNTTVNGATFHGTYAPITKGNFTDAMYGVTSTGQVRPGDGEDANIKGYRAYFTGISAPTGPARPTIVFEDDSEAQGLSAVMWMENTKEAYNLQGQKVEKGRKGIYIVNGRKVVIK